MKNVIFFLVCAFIVAGFLPAGAQEVSPSKELVIDKQELMNALRQISDAVWDMEEQKARPRVEEQALQYRLDRLEKMILDLSLYLGLKPTGVGGQNSIVIDRTRDVAVPYYFPLQPGVAGVQRQLGGGHYPGTFQRQPDDSSGRTDSLQLMIQSLSFQLDSLQRLVNVAALQVAALQIVDAPGDLVVADSLVVPEEAAVRKPLVLPAQVIQPAQRVQPAFDRFKSQVFFAVSSAALTSEGKGTLDEIVAIMERNSGLVANVSGSSSREGNTVYNELLSRKRAESVRDYLTEAGIKAERIVLESAGIDKESDLLLYGRRVDIVLSLGD
jgi:outer membrane protein OmpA-like peptidoglycan-associated protein